jgi:hypothetical protein
MANKTYIFTCVRCGSHNLAYDRYVRSTAEIEFQDDGLMTYEEPVYHDDDTIDDFGGYYCRDCGKYLAYCGMDITTERDLQIYLDIPFEERVQKQKEWEREEQERALENMQNDPPLEEIRYED